MKRINFIVIVCFSTSTVTFLIFWQNFSVVELLAFVVISKHNLH